MFLRFLFVFSLKNIKLYVGGIPFGVKFMTEGILIVGFSDTAKKENPSNWIFW